MGVRYIVSRANITPTAGQDILQLLSASARRFRIIQVVIGGLGTTSAAQQVQLGRATGGTTAGGPITPDKFETTEQVAAVTVCNTTWSVQPTLGTNFVPIGWNALGGSIIWNAPPGGDRFSCRNAEFLSIRANSAGVTFQPMSIGVLFEED